MTKACVYRDIVTEDEYFGTPAQRAARQDRFADHKAWRERTG